MGKVVFPSKNILAQTSFDSIFFSYKIHQNLLNPSNFVEPNTFVEPDFFANIVEEIFFVGNFFVYKKKDRS